MNKEPAEKIFDERKINLASRLHDKTNQRGQDNSSAKFRKGFYERLWKILIKLKVLPPDPIIKRKIGKRNLLTNASHKLPNKLKRFPYYDTALPRVAAFLNQKRGKLIMIDVGANIGDTVNLITDVVDGNFLCIEPSEKYFQLLKFNTQNLKNVVCEQVAVSNLTDDEIEKTLTEVKGTGYLGERETASTNAIQSKTLTAVTTIDKLIAKHPEFSQTNLLKIITDGYDIKALKSAASLLTENQPVIYIQFMPWYLAEVGGDRPAELFEQVKSAGYSNALFYDNHGYPFLYLDFKETKTLSQLITYAKRKSNFFYFILMFPDSMKNEFNEFYMKEAGSFPDFKYVEFRKIR